MRERRQDKMILHSIVSQCFRLKLLFVIRFVPDGLLRVHYDTRYSMNPARATIPHTLSFPLSRVVALHWPFRTTNPVFY